MMIMVCLREADVKDVEDLAKLHVECSSMENIDEAVKHVKSHFEAHYHFYVLEQNSSIIGLFEWIPKGRLKHGLVEIGRVGIAEEFRRRGFGTLLMEESIKKVQDFYKKRGLTLRKMFLLANQTNIPARKLWEKVGFQKEGILEDHYAEGRNEVIYSLF